MKRTKVVFLAIAIIMASVWLSSSSDVNQEGMKSFDECARAGYPIMESNPRQCKTPDGQWFVEEAVSEVCRYSQDCGAGLYCKQGICAELNPEIECAKDEDCVLMNRDLGVSCCMGIDAFHEKKDYAEEKWIAVNALWFAKQQKMSCPSEDFVCPPPLPHPSEKPLHINNNFRAACIQVQCITTPCPPRCVKKQL